MRFHIITIFPGIFNSYFGEGMIKRALEKKQIKINVINLRDFTADKHKTVDDAPYGGGAGMIMKVDVIYRALQNIKSKVKSQKSKVILTSAKGKTWDQELANNYSQLKDIIIICGRYEGVDERIINYADEEISIGNFVLTGGELGAMVMIDSITRLLPGVLGNPDSIKDESFSIKVESRKLKVESYLEYPQYTRPETFIDNDGAKHKVPDILLSGNHGEIEKWREKMKNNKKSRTT